MSGKRVTMQDIADRLGLTKVSVSKAINGQPGISQQTRERILHTAKQMGYHARVGDKGEARQYRFVMLLPKRFFLETDAFYTEIIYYLNRYCLHDGHQVYTVVLNTAEEEGLVLPAVLQEEMLDGVFIIGQLSDAYLHMLSKQHLNAVAVDFYREELRADCVVADNFFIGHAATQYLIDKGHRMIGFVGNWKRDDSCTDRYFGYIKALTLAGLEARQDWIIVNSDENCHYTVDVPLPQPLPTAFVCHCDMAGHYLIETLKNAGLSVPQDVSLITVDNTPLSTHTVPHLTSFDIDRKEFAQHAYHSMLERCKGGVNVPKRLYVNSRLVERDSIRSL